MTRPRRKRKRRKNQMPLSGAVGLAATAFAKPFHSWSSPWEAIQSGRMDLALQSALANLTGITLPMGGHTGAVFDISSLNPFDFTLGAGWKAMLWSSLSLRVINAITGGKGNKMLKTIPLIGKKLSFS